jgi:hypothetical protein
MDFSTAYKEKVDYINKGLISLLKSRKRSLFYVFRFVGIH